jgi:hypothetical protein
MSNILGISILIGLLSSFGLYKQIQANGEIKSELKTANATVISMKAEREKLEITLAGNANKKEIIYREKERIKIVIKRVQIESDPEDCINKPVPDELNCLFKSAGCEGVSNSAETVSSGNEDT